jgi:hypothetical protein
MTFFGLLSALLSYSGGFQSSAINSLPTPFLRVADERLSFRPLHRRRGG